MSQDQQTQQPTNVEQNQQELDNRGPENAELTENKETTSLRPPVPQSAVSPPRLSSITKFLTLTADMPCETVHESNRSYFVPSFYRFFSVLQSMHIMHTANIYAYKRDLSFFSLVSRLYYSILIYVQIFRSMKEAQAISSDQLKFLNKFEKLYKPENLMIAGPLVPFFSALGVYKKKNFGPVYVSTPTKANGKQSDFPGYTTGTAMPNEWRHLPHVLPLIAIINAFSQPKEFKIGGKNIKNIDGLEELLENGQISFLPIDHDSEAKFSGFDIKADTTNGFSVATMSHLNTPTLNHYLPDDIEKVASRQWRQNVSKLGLPKVTDINTAPTTWLEFFSFANTTSWFGEIARHASIEASFYQDSTNLSQVSVITGPAAFCPTFLTKETEIDPFARKKATDAWKTPNNQDYTTVSFDEYANDDDLRLANLVGFSISGVNYEANKRFAYHYDQQFTGPYFTADNNGEAQRIKSNDPVPAFLPQPKKIVESDSYAEEIKSMIQAHFYIAKPKELSP